jgi:hypothetical protein
MIENMVVGATLGALEHPDRAIRSLDQIVP